MKKFIVNILLFIPFLFISYVFLIIVWGSFAPSFIKTNLNYGIGGYANTYSRISEVKEAKDVDILFLGASQTYRGFDPRIFKEYGYKTFNLGSPNQTPIQTKILVERYINKLNPKLIVYEVNPRVFIYDGVESSLDLIANDKIDLESLKMAITLNNIKTYHTLLYGYYRQFFNKNKNFKEDAVKGEDVYISGGFVEKKLSYNKSKRLGKHEIIKWVPKSHQSNSFESIVKVIKEKRIKLILIQAPITKNELARYEDQDKFDAYFSGKTTDYYNFNNLIKMNDSLHFFDNLHLNQPGVRFLNEELIKKVIANVQPGFGKMEAGVGN